MNVGIHHTMGGPWDAALETLGHECEQRCWSVVMSDLRGKSESPCPKVLKIWRAWRIYENKIATSDKKDLVRVKQDMTGHSPWLSLAY